MHYFRTILFIPIVLILTSLIISSCDDGFEDYSTNPNDRLSFSTDTIAFDTIISTINTPFKAFKVYNKNSKNLLVSSIFLEKGANSNFKINVDGKANNTFNDIEIRANDSIYIFVDAKPIETGTNTPQYQTDYIIFQLNGNTQKVLLEASAQDAFIWKGVTITSDQILSNEKPYVIYDSLIIEKDIQLTIPEGTVFYMHKGANIFVEGTLKAKGTPENPIIMRGDRFDQMVNIPYDNIPGQWEGICFTEDSYQNEFEYVYMRNGNFGINCMPADASSVKITLKNSKITNFKGILINAVNCHISAENCEFSNSQKALLNLTGGNYSFTHCTLANHYFSSTEYGWGNSDNETIILSNKYLFFNEEKLDSVFYPITQANFYNSIVWGSKDKSSSQIKINKSDKSDLFYYFENCLIPNGNNDNPNDAKASVINCIIEESPEFKTILLGSTGKVEFIYNFSLTENSPARNVANRMIAEEIPLDIKGIDRFLDDGPDIGAYEWIKEEETDPELQE
ncbi:hypothetical protein LJB92_02075 [Bacteroidales bacterium OttesenSCG-928-M06]|nr:hypothetical protein [Bacteroidales bacterium OttesenSCG-928-M06]